MTEMTSRERIIAALERRRPDRVPMLEWSVSEKVYNALLPGGSYYDFVEWIGYDAVAPGFGNYYSDVEWLDEEQTTFIDNWGVKRVNTGEDIPYPVEGPIKRPEDLKNYTPPDHNAPGVLGQLPAIVERFKGEKAVIFIARDAYINPTYLRGVENLLIDFVENPGVAHELARMSIEYSKVVTGKAVAAGADIVMLGDDYAWRANPMMSPAQFREFIYPYLKELVGHIHDCGAYVVKHSDGNLWPILDMIVDAGFDGINPLEPIAGMDIGEVKAKYGDRVCVIGNIDCGELMCRGSVDEVRAAVRECIAKGSPGGGHILSSSNSIQSGAKPENVVAMAEACREFGKYPIKI